MLRRRAAAECDRGDFYTCIKTLEQALSIDPDGSSDPSVREMHVRAKRAMVAAESAKRRPEATTPVKPKTSNASPILDPFTTKAKPTMRVPPEHPGY
jgi:hypothetical protein